MTCLDHGSAKIDPKNIQEYSHRIKSTYLEKTQVYPPLAIDLKFHQNHEGFQASLQRPDVKTVFTESREDSFLIHLCEACFTDASHFTLQGCLEQEMTLCLQKLLIEFYYINFKKEISPLMPVSGLAENHIRELAHKLELALKNYLATERLIDLDLGLPQVYFRLAGINPDPEDAENYQLTLPYNWSRALFLSRKFIEFMPIFLLEKRRLKRSQELKSVWLKYNDYLLTEDRHRLETMAELPAKHNSSYTTQVVAMFKYMKFHYLAPRGSKFHRQDLD